MKSKPEIIDDRRNRLGEGLLWHPARSELFWVDIQSHKLLSRSVKERREWLFEKAISALGWVNERSVLIAGESELFLFDVHNSSKIKLVDFESQNSLTRSNDGRADPWGGFWISSMGKKAETGMGSIYRYFNGDLVKLVSNLTIPNSICFCSSSCVAYFSDTRDQKIYSMRLDEVNGWPIETPSLFIDLRKYDFDPDGAVLDSRGNIWVAIWGKGLVIMISRDGQIVTQLDTGAKFPTCPAFEGEDLTNLCVISASPENAKTDSFSGRLIQLPLANACGSYEPKVILNL